MHRVPTRALCAFAATSVDDLSVLEDTTVSIPCASLALLDRYSSLRGVDCPSIIGTEGDAIPAMPDERLVALMSAYDECVREQAVLREIFDLL